LQSELSELSPALHARELLECGIKPNYQRFGADYFKALAPAKAQMPS
jgi:hypothetical protein